MRDLTGLRFGHMHVVSYSHRVGRTHRWLVKCDCGKESTKQEGNLLKANGCGHQCPISREALRVRATTHGMKGHASYRIWNGMISRCHNPKRKDWKNYGGRGIYVCDRWKGSFAAFWADMGPAWEVGLTLDRINYDLGYEPSNCRWLSLRDNSRNRRNCLTTPENRDIAASNGIAKATLGYRLRTGWPLDKAITVPVSHSNKCPSS